MSSGGGSAHPAVPILMYHSIGRPAASRAFEPFVVPHREFAAQMEMLARLGIPTFTVLTAVRLLGSGAALPRNAVLLTFDDAYDDFWDNALPVLQETSHTATIFVPTAYPGHRARWLTGCGEGHRSVLPWSALRDVASIGVEVAAHGHAHHQLDRLRRDEAKHDALRARHLLEDNLSRAAPGFAYPYGYWSRAVRESVRASGYEYACAVGELPMSATSHPWAMPRISMRPGFTEERFERLITSPARFLAKPVAECKRIAWRGLRRIRAPWEDEPRHGPTEATEQTERAG